MIDRTTIRRLYLEKLTGAITAADDREFQALLNQHEENRVFLRQLEEETEDLKMQDFIDGIDEEAALYKLKQKVHKKSRTGRPYYWIRYVTAAMVVLIAGYGIIQAIRSPEPALMDQQKHIPKGVQLIVGDNEIIDLSATEEQRSIQIGGEQVAKGEKVLNYKQATSSGAMNTLIVPQKEDYRVVLSDGTQVWINSASRLRYPMAFSGKTREVYLEGEAYFEVAKNTEKPFIVHSGETSIQVLGTSFNVNAYEKESVRTALVEGKVQMQAPDGHVLALTPGFMGAYHKAMGLNKERFDQEEVLGWKEGVYYFRDASLEQIGEVITRWFDLEVIFDDPELAQTHVTGLMEKKDLEGFLQDLQSTIGLKYNRIHGRLHLW